MTDRLRAAAEAALKAIQELEYSSSTAVADKMARDAKRLLRAALDEPEVERAEIGPEWTPCVKRPVTVHVRGQRPGEAHVSTREGLTPVKPDDLIMRGVDGEEYPIGRDLFNRTYSFKAALDEPEERQSTHSEDCYKWHHECAVAMVERLREANEAFGRRQEWWNDRMFELEQQEPVAWLRKNGFRFNAEIEPQDERELPLYASLPRREWVSLTDEEREAAWKAASGGGFLRILVAFADGIEQLLKEKNK